MSRIKLFEYFNADEIKNISDLVSKLKEYKIPYETWGKGYAKTTNHLLDEILTHECTIIDQQGYLIRYIEFVGINVFYEKNGTKYHLKEEKQIFRDGRERRRKMQSSVSEKMKFGEDSGSSAIRGVSEELGVNINPDQLGNKRDVGHDSNSQSYPGLKSKYKGHIFECTLRDDQYKREGYIERQKDKSTYFIWEKIS